MILVTGATGNFGGATAKYLQQENIPFRAAARNTGALKERFGNTGWVNFDWDQPGTFTDALEDIDIVSIVPPPVVENDFHLRLKPFVDAARKAGVKHIVLTTALYSDHPETLFYDTEALVKNSGIDFTIIRPSFVFQNFLNQFLQAVRAGGIVAPSEKGRTSYVDVRNVGEATAAVLANPSAHKGKTYAITGNDALTHSRMAEIFSEQLSRPVVHISPSAEEYKKKLAEMNVPVFLHDFLVKLYGTIAKGQWQEVSGDYNLLTGKKAIAFADFVKENRGTFLGV